MFKQKIIVLFGLSLILFFSACGNTGSGSEITVISPEEVQEVLYHNGSHQLIDVRTLEEFREGHLKNAQNICVTDDDFVKNIEKLDKDKPIYLYCRSGKRSARAANLLKDLGFKEIYDMDGGYLNWQKQGLDTEK